MVFPMFDGRMSALDFLWSVKLFLPVRETRSAPQHSSYLDEQYSDEGDKVEAHDDGHPLRHAQTKELPLNVATESRRLKHRRKPLIQLQPGGKFRIYVAAQRRLDETELDTGEFECQVEAPGGSRSPAGEADPSSQEQAWRAHGDQGG